MPSIVHTSASLNSRGVAIVSDNVTEQPTGLLNVGIEYVTTAANRDRVASQFYADAPPPIYPSSINRDELQARQLFMVSRTVTQSAGLVYINAEYSGAVLRRGSSFLLTTERELKRAFLQWTGFTNIFGSGIFSIQPYFAFYSWINVIHIYEYAVVGAYRPDLPTPDIADLCAIESFSGNSPFVPTYTNSLSLNSTFAAQGGRDTSLQFRSLLTEQEVTRLLAFNEITSNTTSQYVTPSVRLMRREVFAVIPRNGLINIPGYSDVYGSVIVREN